MKVNDFNKHLLLEKVNKTPIKIESNSIDQDVPPIFGLSEEHSRAVRRIRKLSPGAYDQMINWD